MSNPIDPSDPVQSSNANQVISDSQSTKELLNHMARLDFQVKPEGGTFISFHYEYHDYLEEINCVDPSEVKQRIVKKQKTDENVKIPAGLDGVAADSDLEGIEEPSEY